MLKLTQNTMKDTKLGMKVNDRYIAIICLYMEVYTQKLIINSKEI
jgi:hypothetical protein